MNFENISVMNFEGAIRGMRNPKKILGNENINQGDSEFGLTDIALDRYWNLLEKQSLLFYPYPYTEETANLALLESIKTKIHSNSLIRQEPCFIEYALIGPKDMELAKKLIKAGSEHRKFLRQIFVSIDITAPLYVWKELDTYKINTTANSTSTMHKLANTPITLDCFEIDDLFTYDDACDFEKDGFASADDCMNYLENLITMLENLRQMYLKTKDIRYWKELIRWLPESWLQMRTFTCNYENLRKIYHQRKNHKLTEWHQFCKVIETLPYAEDFIIN